MFRTILSNTNESRENILAQLNSHNDENKKMAKDYEDTTISYDPDTIKLLNSHGFVIWNNQIVNSAAYVMIRDALRDVTTSSNKKNIIETIRLNPLYKSYCDNSHEIRDLDKLL